MSLLKSAQEFDRKVRDNVARLDKRGDTWFRFPELVRSAKHSNLALDEYFSATSKEFGISYDDSVPWRDRIVSFSAKSQKEAALASLIVSRSGPGEAPAFTNLTVDAYEATASIELHEVQRQAIEMAMRHPFSIITGGPGTGKTTILRALTWILQTYDIALAAPTAKAAQRMTEQTGIEASTIHRLLLARGDGKFGHGSENTLAQNLVIIDECSMVDVDLFHALLVALRPEARVVLVGDADQLEPVGAGAPFRDLIASTLLPLTRLTKVFRQGSGSGIALNAVDVLAGKTPTQCADRPGFYHASKVQHPVEYTTRTALKTIPDKLAIPFEQIRVLAPLRKQVSELNSRFQALVNPPKSGKRQVQAHAGLLRVGDLVMQMKNDYALSILNGQTGRIVGVGRNGVDVDFDGNVVSISGRNAGRDRLDWLDHAWATTIHKAQGSEYRAVVLMMTPAASGMAKREMLYTAITRAKEVVVLVGPKAVYEQAVNQKETDKCRTMLQEFIRKELGFDDG